jgi:hypothetical protein
LRSPWIHGCRASRLSPTRRPPPSRCARPFAHLRAGFKRNKLLTHLVVGRFQQAGKITRSWNRSSPCKTSSTAFLSSPTSTSATPARSPLSRSVAGHPHPQQHQHPARQRLVKCPSRRGVSVSCSFVERRGLPVPGKYSRHGSRS